MKKKIPRLTANFESLVLDNGYYVDKTEFIQKLEGLNFPNLFFLRPRRFGKSLTLSMLEYYYGIQHKGKFNKLFGQYYIGQPGNTTPLKNSYYILNFSFSGIKTQAPDDIEKEFNSEVSSQIIRFLNTYSLGSDEDQEVFLGDLSSPDMLRKFFTLFKKFAPTGKVYILIDEYDHFTNELFSFDTDHFKEIVSRNGWVRKFYEVIKQFMGEGIIDRFFATGVTPVTLDSMTSGFNVAKNITLNSDFHNMAGFTESELRGMLVNTIYEEGKFDIDTVVSDMRSWYNGSKFSADATERLYNPQMVVSFLSEFGRNWRYPYEMADINVTSDYKKISNILGLLPAEVSDIIIQEILDKESISEKLVFQFNFELPFTRIEAISLLFYNGLLTIQGDRFQVYDFVIPNYVIKVMYWEYFRYLFESRHQIQYESIPVRDALIEMSESGKTDMLVEYVHSILKNLSNRDLQKFSEKNIKMIFMTLLMGNNAYFVKSENENNEGYSDLLLIPTQLNPGKDNFLLELKYLKKSSKESLETEKNKAVEQAGKYKAELAAEGIVCKTYAIVFVGKSAYAVQEVF
ncbi:MAG: ATP-binding protein [Ignavibacteriaceae bacterium]|nr:ATP-binding protein [Ignavibacteriaceae bacterium]